LVENVRVHISVFGPSCTVSEIQRLIDQKSRYFYTSIVFFKSSLDIGRCCVNFVAAINYDNGTVRGERI